MDFRYLGSSGLKISEITYGNWLTHGSQVENDVAAKCVQAALDAGITTFDTADVYANTKAESVLGEALAGQRRESVEIFRPELPRCLNSMGPTIRAPWSQHESDQRGGWPRSTCGLGSRHLRIWKERRMP